MMTFILALFLTLLFAVRVADGIEHGLHWNQDSAPISFHDADLVQTWAIRALYAVGLYMYFQLSFTLAIVLVGVFMVDQAVWQIFLNRFAGNGWFSGELEEAEFSWWPTSKKLFANRGRIAQIIIGLIVILTATII